MEAWEAAGVGTLGALFHAGALLPYDKLITGRA